MIDGTSAEPDDPVDPEETEVIQEDEESDDNPPSPEETQLLPFEDDHSNG